MKYPLPSLLLTAGLLVAVAAPATAADLPAADDFPVVAEPAPTEVPPAAPTGVLAEWLDEELVVSWLPVSGAARYVVTEAPGGVTCESETTECVLPRLSGGTHTVTVTAYAHGLAGPASTPASAFVPVRREKPIFAGKTVVVGKSVAGRTIVAQRQGNPLAPTVLLAIGQMHGSEPAGPVVIDRVRSRTVPRTADYQLWTIRTMNPDGGARGNRYNARGVDLNRNFPGNWSAKALRSGRKGGSEPETRAMMRFLATLQPSGVLSFHQPWDTVLSLCDTRSAPWVRRTAELMRLNIPRTVSGCGAGYPGTMASWFTGASDGWFATVELAGSSRVRPQIPRAASAVFTLAEEMAALDQSASDVVGSLSG